MDDATGEPAARTAPLRRPDAGILRGHRAPLARVRSADDTNSLDDPMSAVSTVHRGVIASRRWPRALHPGHGVEIALRVVDIVVLVLGAHLAHALITGGALPGEQGVCVMATALFALVLFPAAGQIGRAHV